MRYKLNGQTINAIEDCTDNSGDSYVASGEDFLQDCFAFCTEHKKQRLDRWLKNPNSEMIMFGFRYETVTVRKVE